ncbi:hypothetical protein K466DRAFT_584003 [Polyporus arcularius HHB13444]|uniref:F-box domain-containing protein n=1 Tax=Polyporus arcularius HHB13444 TaxID=1314778 RepID=A0A5C3PM41_9APHY|nr:hypothetical protein K466DRAFT_584003 [Polyporus arcularius HHB13444]
MAAQWPGPLPLDAWNLVFDDLDERRDVSSLMRTCGQLYTLGSRPLLGLRDLYFKDVSDLRSFCNFVLGDITRRPGYLRDLILTIALPRIRDGDHEEEEEEEMHPDEVAQEEKILQVIPSLAQILARATGLQELRIGYAEELFQRADISVASEACPAQLHLVTVIASLPSLTSIQLASFGDQTASLLESILPTIQIFDVNFYDARPDAYADCRQFLAPHGNTLTGVRVRNAHMGPPLFIPPPNDPQFSLVRQLTLREVGWLSLPLLVHLFPNISYLVYTTPELAMHGLFDNALEVREANRRALSPWPTLQHLVGGLEGLFVLGLTGKRHRVEILGIAPYQGHARMLHAVLADVLPTNLSLRVGYPGGPGRIHVDHRLDLVVLLRHVPYPLEITHLELHLHMHVLLAVGTYFDVLNMGLIKAALLPFRHLRFCMLHVSRDQYPIIDREPAVSVIQLNKLALDIAAAQPELENLFIDAYFVTAAWAWAVVRTPTSTEVEVINKKEIYAILEREKLYSQLPKVKYTHPVRVVADLAGADEMGVDDGVMRNLPFAD